MRKLGIIALSVLLVVPSIASAQCTGWPVSCTGIHPTKSGGKSGASGPSSGSGGHGLRNIGTAIGIGSAVLGIIQQSNQNAGQQNTTSQPNTNTNQQVNRPARKSSEPPVPVLTPGYDPTLSEIIVDGATSPIIDAANLLVDKMVGPEDTSPPYRPAPLDKPDVFVPALMDTLKSAVLAVAQKEINDSSQQFRSNMNQTHEP